VSPLGPVANLALESASRRFFSPVPASGSADVAQPGRVFSDKVSSLRVLHVISFAGGATLRTAV